MNSIPFLYSLSLKPSRYSINDFYFISRSLQGSGFVLICLYFHWKEREMAAGRLIGFQDAHQQIGKQPIPYSLPRFHIERQYRLTITLQADEEQAGKRGTRKRNCAQIIMGCAFNYHQRMNNPAKGSSPLFQEESTNAKTSRTPSFSNDGGEGSVGLDIHSCLWKVGPISA